MDKKTLVGHKWVTSGGNKACAECASMNGLEFYINPEPGQLRYPDDIPRKPPLHPNCRCKLEPITDFRPLVENVSFSDSSPTEHNPYLHEDSAKVLGGYWTNDGRSIKDGPANWNYCGKNWTAGRNPNNMKPGEDHTLRMEPANDLDAHCKDHDECYDLAARSGNPKEARDRCDRTLVEESRKLPKNAGHWKTPPDNVEDGNDIRDELIYWFEKKVWYYEMEKRHGAQYMFENYFLLYMLFHE